MGVTIHFEGKLKNEDSYEELMNIAIDFARKKKCKFRKINEKSKSLSRVKNEKDWDYVGPVKGIEISIHKHCDPLILEFDKNLYMQEYCKTQFVGTKIHVSIIELLRNIKNKFETFKVDEEGEYWQTSDKKLLETHFKNIFRMLEDVKKKHVHYESPAIRNGRILDIIT